MKNQGNILVNKLKMKIYLILLFIKFLLMKVNLVQKLLINILLMGKKIKKILMKNLKINTLKVKIKKYFKS